VKCLGAACPNPELPKDLQTKQNQNEAKREILENIKNQGIRKMRPEQEILNNGECAEICKIRGQQTSAQNQNYPQIPPEEKKVRKTKNREQNRASKSKCGTKPNKRNAKRKM